MRLIDADALIKWFSPYAHTDECIDFVTLKMDIEDAPTVDAVPVVHGRWEEGCWCSVCHHFSMNAYIKEYANYCPNCGAKMDGDENG